MVGTLGDIGNIVLQAQQPEEQEETTFGNNIILQEGGDTPEAQDARINSAIQSIAGPKSPEQLEAASQVAAEGIAQQRATGDNPLKDEMRVLAENKENPGRVFKLLEAANLDETKYLGALGATLIMGAVGAGIGGKMGALHAIKGGAEQSLKEFEDDEATKREIAKEGRGIENLKKTEAIKAAFREPKKTDAEKIEFEADRAEAIDRRKNEVKREAEIQKAVDGLDLTIASGERVLDQLKKLDDQTWLGFKWRKNMVVDSPEYRAAKNMRLWVFDMLKEKQGSRPSDLDLKNMIDAIEGNAWGGQDGVVKLYEQALNNMKLEREVRAAQLAGKPLTPRQADYDATRSQREGVVSVKKRNAIATYLGRGMSPEDIKKLAAEVNMEVTDAEIEAVDSLRRDA